MSWLFLLMMLGMLVSYPTYFYMLYEFKTRLARDHPDLWAHRTQGALSPPLHAAYQALRAVRDGCLDGVVLTEQVVDSHRLATRFLYVGLSFFMVLLFIFLYNSVWGEGQS